MHGHVPTHRKPTKYKQYCSRCPPRSVSESGVRAFNPLAFLPLSQYIPKYTQDLTSLTRSLRVNMGLGWVIWGHLTHAVGDSGSTHEDPLHCYTVYYSKLLFIHWLEGHAHILHRKWQTPCWVLQWETKGHHIKASSGTIMSLISSRWAKHF